MQWTEKYRPKYLKDVRGQNDAINKAKLFIESFNLGAISSSKRKKALLLHGPPGTGKTTLAYVLANEFNFEIFELNASDLRDRTRLKEILRPAIQQAPLKTEKKGKLILVDEADGITGADKGGINELLHLIDITPYPVVITANDIWSKKLAELRKKCEIAELKEIDYKVIREILFDILRKEGLFIDNKIVTEIAVKSKGDIRAAINDLQSLQYLSASKELDKRGVDSVEIHERNKENDIFNALRFIFKGKPTEETLKIFDSIDMPLDEIMLWVEENIPLEYKGEELAKAYDLLSKADIFKGRIYKQQYWRFLVYENILLSYGISASKSSSKAYWSGFTRYKKPSRILKIWLNNQRIAKKKSIAQKYARHVHIGEKRALKEFPIIKQIIISSPSIQQELKLTEDEIEYLKKH